MEKEQPKNNNTLIALVVAGLLVLAGVGYGIYSYQAKPADETNKTNDSSKMVKEKTTKEICMNGAKLCLDVPKDWNAGVNLVENRTASEQDPSIKGHINEETLFVFDQDGKSVFEINNSWPSEGYSGGWGVGGTCLGKIDRTVVSYKKLGFKGVQDKNDKDSISNREWVVEAVVDKIDYKKFEQPRDKKVFYKARLEFEYLSDEANKPGQYNDMDCGVLVNPGLMFGLNSEAANYTYISSGVDNKEFATKEEAMAELNKPVNKKAFEILSTLRRK